MRAVWNKLRALLTGRKALHADLRAEIESNLALAAEDAQARGLTGAEGRRRFGNRTLIEEQTREAWAFPRLETFAQDVRYGWRAMRQSAGFSLVVILTLALGIGATTAIFSVVDAALLRALPYPHGERLVWLGEATQKAEGISVTWINYRHWLQENHSFDGMAAYQSAHVTLTGRGPALLLRAGEVTSGFFGLLGRRPIEGRVFTDADDGPGAPPTVVLSHQFWTEKLGADAGVVGQTLDLNGQAYTVIGVLAPGPDFWAKPMDVYTALGRSAGKITNRGAHGSLRALGSLKPGLTLASGRADLDAILLHLAESGPASESGHRSYGAFLAEWNTREIRPTLLALMGAVVLVLLIACANTASLLLARSAARGKEMAVRAAIGAGRGRLVRQLVTESLLLAALGGGLGVLLAAWGLHLVIALGPRADPRLAESGLNLEVLLFAAGITLTTGIVIGLAPMIPAGGADLVRTLKDDSRSNTGTRRGRSSRAALVVAEIAITLVLCFGSGLLLRSLIAAQNADPGFAPHRLLALELVLPGSTYKNAAVLDNFHDALTASLRSLPAVTAVGAVNCPPAAGDCGDWFYSVLGQPQPAKADLPLALFNMADSGYFQSMQMPVREGRTFKPSDNRSAPEVAVVNETFARKWWPKGSAVGQRIKVGGPYYEGSVCEIVGVVGDVSQMGLDAVPLPEVYRPLGQSKTGGIVLMLRTATDPVLLEGAVRRAVASIDRNLPIESLRPFDQTLRASLERRRFITLLLSAFATLAMMLAAVGIYGLLSYWVRVREGEIAIRVALGAENFSIVRWVTGQALRLAAAGVVIGVGAGLLASRSIESMVFGTSPQSAGTMAAAALAVLVLVMAASAVPAWRATQVDTLEKLHGG